MKVYEEKYEKEMKNKIEPNYKSTFNYSSLKLFYKMHDLAEEEIKKTANENISKLHIGNYRNEIFDKNMLRQICDKYDQQYKNELDENSKKN